MAVRVHEQAVKLLVELAPAPVQVREVAVKVLGVPAPPTPADVALAGVVPPVTAVFSAHTARQADLAATVPAPTASFTGGVSNGTEVDLAASVPAVSAAFDAEIDAPKVVHVGSPQMLVLSVEPGIADVEATLELVVLTPEAFQTPTSVQVTVSNVVPGEVVTFSVGGVTVFEEASDSTGTLEGVSIPLENPLPAGAYVLVATSPGRPPSSDDFVLLEAPEQQPIDPPADIDPVPTPGVIVDARRRWVLQDLAPGGLGSWIMPRNPTAMTDPYLVKTVTAAPLARPAAGSHIFEAASMPTEWQFQGLLSDKASVEMLQRFAALNRWFYVIDHRGRAWTATITNAELVPRRRTRVAGVMTDWAVDYTISASIFSPTPKVVPA